MKIECMTLGPMQVNCYIVMGEEESKAFVIDPGDCAVKVYERLKELGVECAGILLTHGHFDHITGVNELKELTGSAVYAGKDEERLLLDSDLNVSKRIRHPVTVKADKLLEDGEEVAESGLKFKTLFTPGHTDGSVCFYFEDEGVLFSGDTIFKQGMGRTDLPTGCEEKLFYSLTHKLMKLPGETKCYPGHGGTTDIASESGYYRN